MFPAKLLLIASLACTISSSLAACPPAENIVPCYCAIDALFCRSSVTTTTDLQRIMFVLIGRGTFKVDLRNLKLGDMSLPIYKVVNITEMKITDSELESIMDPTSGFFFYAASYTLKVLKISNSIDTSKKDFRMNLMSLRALKEVDLFGNNMKRVGSDLFMMTPDTVTKIALVHNKIEDLEDGTFEKFRSLEELKLDKNKITTITRSILPSTPIPLWLLSLSSNQLTSIPSDLFYRIHFLSDIDISGNKITELSERTWQSVWSSIDRLNAKENKLDCDDAKIEWMVKTSHPRNMEATCYSPDERKDKSLSVVIEEEKEKTTVATTTTTAAPSGNKALGLIQEYYANSYNY